MGLTYHQSCCSYGCSQWREGRPTGVRLDWAALENRRGIGPESGRSLAPAVQSGERSSSIQTLIPHHSGERGKKYISSTSVKVRAK